MTTIAISRTSGASPAYAKYVYWLKAALPDVECLDMWTYSSLAEAVTALEGCSGLLLTGGPDVHPARHGKAGELSRCEIDAPRDELEFALYEKAREIKMPTLGICRGSQLLNVAHGGSLVIDIPADTRSDRTKTIEHGRVGEVDSTHIVVLEEGSLLIKITGEVEGRVNSAHHQSVERVGEGLRAGAFSEDGICESIEWDDPAGKPFLLGVQWHPERMEYDSPFSLRLARHFLFEAESYRILMRRS